VSLPAESDTPAQCSTVQPKPATVEIDSLVEEQVGVARREEWPSCQSGYYDREHINQTHKCVGGTVSELLGIARFKFHEGKAVEFKRLSAQAMEIVRTKDTGTLQYDIYFNDDQSECMVLERYRDSEAAIEHAANLGDLFGAVLATVSVVHGELLGEPSAELRAKLAGSEVPVLFTPFLSM
jgi:quinol monooxygenase YgiN